MGGCTVEDGTFVAGALVAAALAAGALVAGALPAGALVAGALAAGTLAAGALAAGALVAGALVAGTLVAGALVAGAWAGLAAGRGAAGCTRAGWVGWGVEAGRTAGAAGGVAPVQYIAHLQRKGAGARVLWQASDGDGLPAWGVAERRRERARRAVPPQRQPHGAHACSAPCNTLLGSRDVLQWLPPPPPAVAPLPLKSNKHTTAPHTCQRWRWAE